MPINHEDAFKQGREDGFAAGLVGEKEAPEGAIVDTVVCAIWRGNGAPKIASEQSLTVLPVFTRDDLE